MEVSAKLRGARISAQKVRLVADQVRGKPVGEALTVLEFSTKKAAQIIRKILNSAIAKSKNHTFRKLFDSKRECRYALFDSNR